jgi:hypothetical protein
VPGVIALAAADVRRAADAVDRIAVGVETRATEAARDAGDVRWLGPRRDRFVEETASLVAGDGRAGAEELRALAAALRALAREAEEHAAHLRQLEAIVRAGLAGLARELADEAHALRTALHAAAALAGAIGLDGAQREIQQVEDRLQRLRVLMRTLPPHEDPLWEVWAAAWAARTLV